MAPAISAARLLLVLILAPIIGGGLGELTNGVLQILLLSGIGIRLLARGKDDSNWARVPGLWFLGAFLALTLISTLQSRAIYFSLNQVLFLLACLGAYLLSASECRDRRIATALVWSLLLAGLYVSGAGIQNYIIDAGGGPGFWKSLTSSGDHARLFGPFLNPDFFAGFLVIALPVTLGVYLVTRRGVFVALAGLGFVFEVAALLLTGAKSGVLAAAGAFVVFLVLAAASRSLSRARLARLVAIAVILIPIVIPFSAPFRARVREAKAGGAQVHSAAFRVYTWRATLHMIEDQPWLGVGPGVYGITYPRYTIAGPTKFAHNSYLQIAAESGVPALAAFLLLLLAIGWRSGVGILKRSTADATDEPPSDSIAWSDLVPAGGWRLMSCALFAALLASAVRSLADSDWYVMGIALPFWIVAGALVSLTGASQRDMSPGKVVRWTLAGLCVVAIVLSAAFGFGDYFASRADQAAKLNKSQQATELYRRAVDASPLNPEYRRQLGVWLALGEGDLDGGYKEIDTSIRLAPNTSEGGWKARGILAGAKSDWPLAISSLKTAVKFNPNSTDTLDYLARAYKASGDTRGYESTLERLIQIEQSPYEKVKGTPELIDTTFAFAHYYFANKHLSRKEYSLAAAEFGAAIDRLEQWKASGSMRTLQQYMGINDPAKEKALLALLRDCYKGLAAADAGMGRKAEAEKALAQGRKVK